MCTSNHASPMGKPGYLLNFPMKSISADGALFTRTLANYAEVGLSCDEIMDLLEVSREYHARQIEIQQEFAIISERLEIKWGRVDDLAIAEREDLLKRHGELFVEHERLFFEMAKRGHEVLTDEQIERAEKVYWDEVGAGLEYMAPSLDSAVGPNYSFSPVEAGATEPERVLVR